MKFVKIVVILLVVAAVVALGVKKIKHARKSDASQPQAKIYPIVAPVMQPKEAKVTLTLPYLAEVANDKDVKLASRIAARIVSIVPSGSHVKKGQIVVKLDKTAIESKLKSVKEQIAATKIALSNLESTHKRTEELLKVHGASIEQSQKELTQIASTKAKLNALEQQKVELLNNLSYATITSPVDGIVSKTFAARGSLSAPGKPLMAISSKNGFYLMVRVPNDVAVKGVKFQGKFYDATPLNTTFRGLVEYKVYTGDAKLISGDRVQVDVVTFDQKATLLPFDAVLNRNGKSYVLVVDGNKATPQEIHIVQSAEQGVAVSDNLEGKQIVIAKPDILLKLVSGYALKIKE